MRMVLAPACSDTGRDAVWTVALPAPLTFTSAGAPPFTETKYERSPLTV